MLKTNIFVMQKEDKKDKYMIILFNLFGYLFLIMNITLARELD